MALDIKVWSNYYKRINKLGAYLKEARDEPRLLETGEKQRIEEEIAQLTKDCTLYMDVSGCKAREPLWRYDVKDESTWFSSPKFKFAHLAA